jgi:uncharacterized membrane protein YqgA involved in biofilm formation
MIGSFLNVTGILVGGAVGLARHKSLPASTEAFAKVAVAAFTVFYGLRLIWMGMGGPFVQIIKQFVIAIVAMMLGKLLGRLLRLQKISNQIGQWAREKINVAKPGDPDRISTGFKVCAALFCAAPLGVVGAVADSLNSPPYFYPLAVKGIIDGLAALGLVSLFGWGVLFSAVPVLAFQGSLTFVCFRFLEPLLSARDLIGSVNMVGGLLIFSVALVLLGLKRIELTDYLPSLFLAPLLTRILA